MAIAHNFLSRATHRVWADSELILALLREFIIFILWNMQSLWSHSVLLLSNQPTIPLPYPSKRPTNHTMAPLLQEETHPPDSSAEIGDCKKQCSQHQQLQDTSSPNSMTIWSPEEHCLRNQSDRACLRDQAYPVQSCVEIWRFLSVLFEWWHPIEGGNDVGRSSRNSKRGEALKKEDKTIIRDGYIPTYSLVLEELMMDDTVEDEFLAMMTLSVSQTTAD